MNIETTCAVSRLSDGLVINIIIAAPSDLAPEGCQLVEIMSGQICDIGWYYANGVFNGPRNYAMCSAATNEVVSFFSASYVSPVPVPPADYFVIEVLLGIGCGIGWTWDGMQFTAPVA